MPAGLLNLACEGSNPSVGKCLDSLFPMLYRKCRSREWKLINMNNSKIKRNFRANLTETVSSRLEKFLASNNLSRSNFATLMSNRKFGYYRSYNSCYHRITDLLNGRCPSDEFCTNTINMIQKVKENSDLVDSVIKVRSGFRANTGEAFKTRDTFLSSDRSNSGRMFVRRLLRKSIKDSK